jgi:hypothetical protein
MSGVAKDNKKVKGMQLLNASKLNSVQGGGWKSVAARTALKVVAAGTGIGTVVVVAVTVYEVYAGYKAIKNCW